MIIQGKHQGFIKKDIFEKVQRFMDERFQCHMKKIEMESLLKNGQGSIDEGEILMQLQDFLKIWESGSDLQKRMQIKELVKEIAIEGENRFRIRYNFLP